MSDELWFWEEPGRLSIADETGLQLRNGNIQKRKERRSSCNNRGKGLNCDSYSAPV
jgi:hypothetical protein